MSEKTEKPRSSCRAFLPRVSVSDKKVSSRRIDQQSFLDRNCRWSGCRRLPKRQGRDQTVRKEPRLMNHIWDCCRGSRLYGRGRSTESSFRMIGIDLKSRRPFGHFQTPIGQTRNGRHNWWMAVLDEKQRTLHVNMSFLQLLAPR